MVIKKINRKWGQPLLIILPNHFGCDVSNGAYIR